jgi:hypothetical protein
MDLREIGREGVKWTHVAQDRGHWRAFVSTVINLWVPECPLALQEEFCFM